MPGVNKLFFRLSLGGNWTHTIAYLSILLFSSCQDKHAQNRFLDGAYWKDQAVSDILPYWTKHAFDSVQGGFHCNLDEQWKLVGDDIRYPSMISRHLFSYSSAYLMSGEELYLNKAKAIKNYLLLHAWDRLNGGWYDALQPSGDPMEYSKSTFVQVYVITGLAMYYTVTHDKEILDYINKSNDLLEQKAWDPQQGGYFDALSREWIVNSQVKSCSAQLAPISGYLIYLYLATHNTKYLQQAERISDIILKKMQDPVSGWIMESFDKDWKYQQPVANEFEINIGHNIEVAWSLLRLYAINHRQDYLQSATTLAGKVRQYGFNPVTGMWTATTSRLKPVMHSNFTYWWIQAYGNMFDLYLNRLHPGQHYLIDFEKGALFWDTYFLDRIHGDTHLSVLEDGAIKESNKANRYKASYHSMEHGLLNYLYLENWVHRKPLTLFFKLESAKAGEVFYPLPIESTDLKIASIQIDNKNVEATIAREGFIALPELNHARIGVNLNAPAKE
jgi:mannobiose 2-epimerase